MSKSFEFISLHQMGSCLSFCLCSCLFPPGPASCIGQCKPESAESIDCFERTGLFVPFHLDGTGIFHRNLFPVFRPDCSFLHRLLHLASIARDLEIHCCYVCHLQFCGSQYYHCRDLSLPAGISAAFHPESAGGHRGIVVPFKVHGDYEHHPVSWDC